MRSVDLIDSLAADLKRVVPLPPPSRRLAFWLFASLLYIGAMALAVLAATSLGAAALRLFHVQDASVMLLVWQFGTVALLTSAAAIFGDPLLPRLEARAAAIRSDLCVQRHTDL